MLPSPSTAIPPRSSKSAAHRALECDPLLADAHASRAAYLFFREWRWREAEGHLQRAIELRPDYAVAHQWYSFFLAAMGDRQRAAAEMVTARALQPLSLATDVFVGSLLYFARDLQGRWHTFGASWSCSRSSSSRTTV